jgi:polysaccharide chain length determinant protein (PEP-CTERM system associated)
MSNDLLNPNNDQSLVLRTLDILRRRRVLAVVVFTTVLAAATSFARYLPDLYKTTALLLIERPVSENFVRTAGSGELESRLHVIKQENLSRDRLTDLIERFDLYPDMRRRTSMDDVLNQMRLDIETLPSGPEQVAGRTRTVSMTLSYTGSSRDSVADVTNAIAAFYVSQNDRMRSEEAVRTSEFLKAQLDDARQQLSRQEQAMRSYTARYIGEMPQQVGVNLATLERLNAELRMNADRQLATIEQREKLLDGLAETSALTRGTMGSSVSTADALSDDVLERLKQIEKMQADLVEMETRFTSRHPDVVTMRERIANLQREVDLQKEREATERRRQQEEQQRGATAGAPSDTVPPQARRRTLETLDAQMVSLQKDEANIRKQISTYEGRLEVTPERQQDYNLITRDYQAAKDLYDSLLKRYEEANFAASVETDRQGERFRILEPALAPAGPAAPNRLRLILLGVLLALAMAAMAVIAAEQLDTSFHSVDDLREFTSVPVLATIPRIGRPSVGHRLRMGLTAVSVVGVIALVATISAYLARGNEQIVRMLERAG